MVKNYTYFELLNCAWEFTTLLKNKIKCVLQQLLISYNVYCQLTWLINLKVSWLIHFNLFCTNLVHRPLNVFNTTHILPLLFKIFFFFTALVKYNHYSLFSLLLLKIPQWLSCVHLLFPVYSKGIFVTRGSAASCSSQFFNSTKPMITNLLETESPKCNPKLTTFKPKYWGFSLEKSQTLTGYDSSLNLHNSTNQ